MKVIDMLDRIANGEEVPKKIKYDDNIYVVNKIVLEKGKVDIDYYCNDNCEMLFADVIPIHRCLNEEVEVIEYKPKTMNDIRESCGLPRIEEDKKIEKLYKQEVKKLKSQLQQKENIIKEVREYNESILKERWYGGNEKKYAKHNLEILDKESQV